jgi:putative tricarboxylic transport membrane protein
MKLNDAVFGLLLLLLGGSVLFTVQSFPKIPGQQVGPALFPGLIAVGLCISGVILCFRGWQNRASVPWLQWADWVGSPKHAKAFLVLIASIVFYIVCSTYLGFLICASLVLLVLFYVLEVPLPRASVIALIATLVIHFAFYKLLRVPLPWGILQSIAW